MFPLLLPEPRRVSRFQAQTTTSGTAFDFIGLFNTDHIIVLFDAVSLSGGTDNLLVQIGGGSFETSGYDSTDTLLTGAGNALVTSSSGFVIRNTGAAEIFSGAMDLYRIDAGDWIARSSGMREDSTATQLGGGSKTITGELDRVRITRTGSETFDSGQVNILVK